MGFWFCLAVAIGAAWEVLENSLIIINRYREATFGYSGFASGNPIADIGWGLQYDGTSRFGANDDGYAYDDIDKVTGWVRYKPAHWISVSGHLAARMTGRMDTSWMLIVGWLGTF